MIADRMDPGVQDERSVFREATEANPRGFRGATPAVKTRSRLDRAAAGAIPARSWLLDTPVATAYAIDDPSRRAETVREGLSGGRLPITRGGGLGYPGRVHERAPEFAVEDTESSVAQSLRKRGPA